MKTELIISEIESNTNYDVLNGNEFSIDVIDRRDSDEVVKTLEIYNLSLQEIISRVSNL